MATGLLLSLLPAAAAFADPPPSPQGEPELILQEVAAGPGWQRLIAVDKNFDPNSKAMIVPEADLLVVGLDGIDDLPIAKIHKDDLYRDFGIGLDPKDGSEGVPASPDSLIVVDYRVIEQMDSGIWTPEYLALAEYDEPGSDPGGEMGGEMGEIGEVPAPPQPEFLCSGWKNGSKSKNWNLNNSPFSQSYNLGGGFTGNLSVSLPVAASGNAQLNYRYKRNAICIPYKFEVKNVVASGQAALAGSAQLQASASLAYHWGQEWQIASPHLGRVTFWVGFIPVWIDFDLPVDVGVDIDAKLTGTLSQSFDLGATGAFSYDCNPNTCTGNSNFQDHFETSGLSASLQADFSAQVSAKVQLRAELYDRRLLNARAGFKAYAKASLWGYYGNNCGDGNGDGQNETVRAALAEAEAGLDFVYGIGGALVPDYSGSTNLRKWDLGWWDLLGQGGSTVLSPMLAGPTTALPGQTVSYTVKMRPCYPYSQGVTLQMGPGTWSGNPAIAKPKSALTAENSTTLSSSFATAGDKTITATAVRDAKGRELQAATSRSLNVQQPVIRPRGGLWYNPARSGNGIDFTVNMYDEWVATWYTYEGTEPVWYITDVAQIQGNAWSATLYRSTWNPITMYNSLTVVGSLGLTFHSETSATFNWSLYGASGSEPYELLHSGYWRSGLWYPPSESGWGISISEDGFNTATTVSYYDGTQPTWVQGSPGTHSSATLYRHHATGLCPGCTGPINRWYEEVGSISVGSPPNGGNYILVTTNLPGWMRSQVPFYQLTGH